MVDQAKTLTRLRKERDYEDWIAKDFTIYLIESLEDLNDTSKSDKEKIKKSLKIIQNDSLKHERMFERLIERVIENGENKY